MRKTLAVSLLTLLFALSLISCASVEDAADQSATETAVTVMEDETVDGLFDIEGLNIASYRIRGEGPDGAYFDWVEAETPRIALADIRRGEWTLYAQGLNAKGEPVVQGQMTTFLSENSPVDTLAFDESYGNGNVRCALAWNTAQVQHPSVEVFLKTDDGEFQSRSADEIVYGNGTAIWSASDLPSGSYVARFILKDRSTVVSGAAAALRVIDDKTSVGNVRLTIGDLSQVYGITLDNIPAETVNGFIQLEDTNAVFESESTGLLYDWYLDGQYVGSDTNTDNISLSGMSKGYHRVDVVARSNDYGSINSDSIHIYTDGERVKEIAEEEVNSTVEKFEATLSNLHMLEEQNAKADSFEEAPVATAVNAEAEPVAETLSDVVLESPVEETVEPIEAAVVA